MDTKTLHFKICSHIFLKIAVPAFKRKFHFYVYFGTGGNLVFYFLDALYKTVGSDFEFLWINHLKWPTEFAIYLIKCENESKKKLKGWKIKSISK